MLNKDGRRQWSKTFTLSNDTELFDAVGQAIKKAITDDLLIAQEDKIQKQSDTNNLKKRLYSLNPSIERTHLEELIRIHLPEITSLKNLQIFAMLCHHQLAFNAEFRLLADGSRTLFPEAYLPKQTKETFQSISDLIVQHSSNLQREGRYKKLLRISQKN